MGAIGDLFFTIRGQWDRLHAEASTEGTKAGGTLGQHISAGMKKSWSRGELGKGLVQGLGLAGALGGAALVTRAVSGIINVLGDAVNAALEEEKSIALLDATLRTNVKGWDGNREAIEKVLQARMRLGFSDDEQRESLRLLVAATGDSTKALNIQRTAMDLARLKGISLQAASEALVKVEGGQFRILKSLGIQLPKNATATEALAAVQKIAAGSAEAFANTTGGKMLASQVKIGEVMERLGGYILPLVADALQAISDFAEDAVGPVTDFIENSKREFEELARAGDAVHDFFALLLEPVSDTRDALFKAGEEAQRFADGALLMTEEVGGAAKGSVSAITTIAVAAEDTADRVDTSLGDIVASLKARTAEMKGLSEDAGEALYGEIDRRATLSRINVEKAEIQKNISSGKLRGQDLADAKQKLRDLNRAQIDAITDLVVHGEASQKELDGQVKDLIAGLHGATAAEEAAILRLIAAMGRAVPLAQRLADSVGTATGGRVQHRAAGGPVYAGGTFQVGEKGPETLHMFPGGGGFVDPHGAQSSVRGSGTIHVLHGIDAAAAVMFRKLGFDEQAIGRALADASGFVTNLHQLTAMR